MKKTNAQKIARHQLKRKAKKKMELKTKNAENLKQKNRIAKLMRSMQ